PKPYLYCEDPAIMDKHFYIMEKKSGVVIDKKLPDAFPTNNETGREISKAVIDSLVELQKVNITENGLDSIGKPEGYLSRQVHGWIKRYNHSKTDEIAQVGEVEEWLLKNIPDSPSPT